MVVKYLEVFRGFERGIKPDISKVISDCKSIRLVPDAGNSIGVIFLYMDDKGSTFIPFTSNSESIEYFDQIIDISIANGVVDLSAFEAIRQTEYRLINSVASVADHFDPRAINSIGTTISNNDAVLREYFENIKKGVELRG